MIIEKNLSKMNTNYHYAFEYLESKFKKKKKITEYWILVLEQILGQLNG